MERRNFKFRACYHEALNLVADPAERAELAMAIVTYGTTGEVLPTERETVRVAMALIMPMIDADCRRSARTRKPKAPQPAPESDGRIAVDDGNPAEADDAVGADRASPETGARRGSVHVEMQCASGQDFLMGNPGPRERLAVEGG